MIRRVILLLTWLMAIGLSISAPVFASNTPAIKHAHTHNKVSKAKAKTAPSTQAKNHKTNHAAKHLKPKASGPIHKKTSSHPTHIASKEPKKELRSTKVPHHVLAKNHHAKAVSVAENNDNPQDYILSHNQDLATSIAANSSNTSQDLVNGGFNQQLNLRLANTRNAICANAEAQVGKPYEWGGEDPDLGFDCSGLSQFIYAQEGIMIPRTALQQYQSLQPVKNLKAGDLVFFRTHDNSREVSHVGIYVGEGYFVHAPRTGEFIRMSRLDDPYWHEHYAGARRVLTRQSVAEKIAFNKTQTKEENS